MTITEVERRAEVNLGDYMAVRALIRALAEIERTRYVRTPAGAKRYGLPIGSPIGGADPTAPTPGRGRGTVQSRLASAIEEHLAGNSSADPFDGFSREHLRQAAKARGIQLDRGESRESISQKLLDSTGAPADVAPKAPAAPKRRPPARRPNPAAPLAAAVRHAEALGTAESVSVTSRQAVTRELTRQAKLTPNSMRKLDAVNLARPGSQDGQAYLDSDVGTAYGAYQAHGLHPSVRTVRRDELGELRPTIWLNPKWSGDHGHGPLSESKRKAIKAGWSPPTETATPLEASLAHEYGHHVANVFVGDVGFDGTPEVPLDLGKRLLPVLNEALGAERFGSEWDTSRPDRDLTAPVLSGYRDNLQEKFSGAILNSWVGNNKSLITRMVSAYAATDFHELLAEIWAEYSTMGAAARPHIKTIGDLMRELAEEARA